MKTVVTGGAGFIGSNLVKKLIDRGREVVIVDDFSRGSRLNLQDLGIRTDWPVIDLRDYVQTLKAIRGAESVFHLAARIGSIVYLHGNNLRELLALQTNLAIDTNVFRACLECNVKSLVYASSAATYPLDSQFMQGTILRECDFNLSRSGQIFHPDGGYGWSKIMSEIQLNWMCSTKVGIARIFNAYGENLDLKESVSVIPTLIFKAILYPKEGFTVWGDGKQSRDFLYVEDCVDALLELESKASDPPIVVNIGSGEPTSISAIAGKVVELSGKDIHIEYNPNSQSVGPISRTADISKALSLLDWRPQISLDEGLQRTYLWIQRRLTTTERTA
jgi:nucleoside-diphosphate-sugar epimerase